MQACPADAQGEGGRDAELGRNADATSSKPQAVAVRGSNRTRRTSTPGRQEQEARALLVGVPLKATMGISAVGSLQLVHDWTLAGVLPPCLNNPGNYS